MLWVGLKVLLQVSILGESMAANTAFKWNAGIYLMLLHVDSQIILLAKCIATNITFKSLCCVLVIFHVEKKIGLM